MLHLLVYRELDRAVGDSERRRDETGPEAFETPSLVYMCDTLHHGFVRSGVIRSALEHARLYDPDGVGTSAGQ